LTQDSADGETVASLQADRAASQDADRSLDRQLLPSYGFSYSEMSPLVKLWNRESGWDETAENSSSGAYGIPQALPGNKMATADWDWRTNPTTQIKWGLGYIKSVYGSPSAAWSHSQSTGWY